MCYFSRTEFERNVRAYRYINEKLAERQLLGFNNVLISFKELEVLGFENSNNMNGLIDYLSRHSIYALAVHKNGISFHRGDQSCIIS